MSRVPRAMTSEEMVRTLITHLRSHARYWATVDLGVKGESADSDRLRRCEGVLHSVLATLDGVSGDIPAINIVPAPHSSDAAYYAKQGKDWWAPISLSEDMLHDRLYENDK
jgi:hypothetical protein